MAVDDDITVECRETRSGNSEFRKIFLKYAIYDLRHTVRYP